MQFNMASVERVTAVGRTFKPDPRTVKLQMVSQVIEIQYFALHWAWVFVFFIASCLRAFLE